MTDELVQKAEEMYGTVNSERGAFGDDAVTLGNLMASYMVLLSSVKMRGLLEDPRVAQARKIAKMADSRDIKSILPEENTFDYAKSVYLLSKVLNDSIREEE